MSPSHSSLVGLQSVFVRLSFAFPVNPGLSHGGRVLQRWPCCQCAVVGIVMPSPLTGGGIKWCCCLTSVCRVHLAYKSRTERPRKIIGIEVAHVTRDSDTTFKVKSQRSRWPGRFTHRGVNASGSCSGERGNVLAVGTYCYVSVSTLQARSARRGEALRRPQREERGGGILWGPPAYSLLSLRYRFQALILFGEMSIFIIISYPIRKCMWPNVRSNHGVYSC